MKRAIVAGGDTSSHALGELQIFALTTRMPLPGSPMCLGHSESTAFDGIEIAFKGGQIGNDGYLSKIRDGIVL